MIKDRHVGMKKKKTGKKSKTKRSTETIPDTNQGSITIRGVLDSIPNTESLSLEYYL